MIAEGLYPVPVVVITPFAQERRHADRILDECLTVDDPATLTTVAQGVFRNVKPTEDKTR